METPTQRSLREEAHLDELIKIAPKIKFTKMWNKRLAGLGQLITTYRRWKPGKPFPRNRRRGSIIVCLFPDRELVCRIVKIIIKKSSDLTEDFIRQDADITQEDYRKEWNELMFSFYWDFEEDMRGVIYVLEVLQVKPYTTLADWYKPEVVE